MTQSGLLKGEMVGDSIPGVTRQQASRPERMMSYSIIT